MYIKLDREYEIKTTLGTIKEIEKTFGKSFFEVINSLSNMKIEEQIKMLYVGVKKANLDMTENAFAELCDSFVGLGDLMEYLEQYIYALQYPGLTEQEVQDKLEKKLQRTHKLQSQMR
ncbi:MAG: hypothetical protein LBU60_06445 [Clostridiales bacterium]|jgi:dimeric dUTPase (all-alpha-NTP-PPase superfamily)|nr:hypothetical protein [Clostridiales bacterium]